ncbi:MAG TPA: hypothetical protein VNQ79_16620 [Blastocatellia bacterium]|nr:hypothetical protein [Blastocatellia bacterium]
MSVPDFAALSIDECCRFDNEVANPAVRRIRLMTLRPEQREPELRKRERNRQNLQIQLSDASFPVVEKMRELVLAGQEARTASR